MVWGNHKNILTQNLFTYIEKMEDYKRDLCVRGFHVYRDIYAMLGSVPPYVSAISGTVVIVCASFYPLPYLVQWMSFAAAPPALLDSTE